jgi:hypothetical protein
LQKSKEHGSGTGQKTEPYPFALEITVVPDRPFYDILLEAIDEAFSTLGESPKASIYFSLEKLEGIKKQEIPFRIDDFQNALEKLFGIGARHLEILFIKKLHEKIKARYKWDMPRWVVPELTFKEYIRLAKMSFEKSNKKINNETLEFRAFERK